MIFEQINFYNTDVSCFCVSLFQINEEEVKKRIVGITRDGAFAKGNQPFKTTIVTLLGKEITIRWDILHLINRAHKDARGEAMYDHEDTEDGHADIESDATTQQIAPNITIDQLRSGMTLTVIILRVFSLKHNILIIILFIC